MRRLLRYIVIKIMTWEAKLLLWRTKPLVVAVTGSVGKTTTKDAIYTVVKKGVWARKSEKSYNSEVGVPLSVLGLPNGWSDPLSWLKNISDGLVIALFPGDYPKVLVLEVGVDRPGDMVNLTNWLKPDVVVLTRLPVVPVHVEFFPNPEAVVEEKMQLVKAIKPDGTVVYNADDPLIVEKISEIDNVKKVSFGLNSGADFWAEELEIAFTQYRPVGTKARILHHEEQADVEMVGVVGSGPLYAYVSAVAVGSLFDVSLKDAVTMLSEMSPTPGRMRLVPGIKRTMMIDDTYNSSPAAVEQALCAVRDMRSYGYRKLAILGDMLELGRYSTAEHEKVGELVATCVDALVAVGVRARSIAMSAERAGMPPERISIFENVDEVAKVLLNELEEGDLILIKGSQGMRLERLVKALMEDPEQAGEWLVRQEDVWGKKNPIA